MTKAQKPADEVPQARAAVASAKDAHGAALKANQAESTPETIAALQQTRAALTAAQDALLDAEALAHIDRQDEEQRAAELAAKNVAARCARVLALQEKREGESQDAAQLADATVAALTKVSETSAELYRALEPLLPQGSAQIVRETALTEPGLLTAYLRVHLAGRGWKWITQPILHGQRTSFAQRIEEAGGYIKTILPTAAE
jgi:hypothetical protein